MNLSLFTARIPPKVEIWPQGELAVALGGQFEFHCRILAGVPTPEILWSRSRERPLSRSTHLQPHAVLKYEHIISNYFNIFLVVLG